MRAAAHGFPRHAHCWYFHCAEPYDFASSVITKEEVEARGSGTREGHDTYDPSRPLLSELRVFFTGVRGCTDVLSCDRTIVAPPPSPSLLLLLLLRPGPCMLLCPGNAGAAASPIQLASFPGPLQGSCSSPACPCQPGWTTTQPT